MKSMRGIFIKMKKKALLSSILTIALCISLIAGSTFALFTSESKVNIAVTSGNVEMIAAIDNIQTWSLEDDKTSAGRTDGTFTQGGSASFDANTASFTINKIIPGDKVSFDITATNESNVAVQYRYKIVCEEGLELMSGLLVTINENEYNFLKSYTSPWASLEAEASVPNVAVSIELPAEAGNEFQELVTKITVTVEAVQGNASVTGEKEVVFFDLWDGTADTSWYNETATEFTMTSAEQLAGLAELVDNGNNFAGKTIMLDADMDLYAVDENGNSICFDPIGSYRKDIIFEGTFDGQNHTIANMSQNTWALDNGYYYGDLGLGLFGAVENATIKNLVMDNASISGESALCGTIAAVAGDNVTFENITVKNSKVADYQYYAGGIVGWAGGDEQFINCVIDASTTIGAQWGEFNNANGGVIGGVSSGAAILIKDCTVACRIDAYNDVTSAYEWYSYRRSGMLIGDSGQVDDPDGNNVGNAIAPNLTCENVTVIYGDWANYHYCEFSAMNYPWVRVESGTSNGAYSNPRYGHPTDANGNEVVDENHVHNDGEKHNELIVFDQLYGGTSGDRYCTYGTATHDGVTVIYNNK